MWRIRDRIASFMYGRYGNDKFNTALLVLYLIMAVVNVIIRNLYATSAFFLLQWAIFAIVIFRMFSRNIQARRRENEWFQRNFAGVIGWFKLLCRRVRDIRRKRYRRCPHCRAVLRLPVKRGKHNVKCPSCKTDFKVNIMF